MFPGLRMDCSAFLQTRKSGVSRCRRRIMSFSRSSTVYFLKGLLEGLSDFCFINEIASPVKRFASGE